MAQQIDVVTADIDKSMRLLRDAMKGIQIRTAGFKKDHDRLARAVAAFVVTLVDAQVLLGEDHRRARSRAHSHRR